MPIETPTTSPARPATLLSPDFMHQLDRLDVLSRKILSGKLLGERRGKKRGQSVEFADYRPYVSGDDLRFIDWNLYARLDKLFLRLFLEEEDLGVTVLVDVSPSMDWGNPNKLHFARQLAAALSYVGLANYNRVSLMSFSDTVRDALPSLRGRRPIPQMLDFLQNLTPAEGVAGDLAASCKRLAMVQRHKGVVILISDFFEKGDLADGLRYLTGDRFDVYALQVLSPEEIDPSKAGLAGDLTLRDVEDEELMEVSITPAMLKRYRQTVQAFCEHVRHACLKRGIAYLLSDSSTPFETLVLRYLRERGMLG